METINAGIITLFMSNIDKIVVEQQHKAVEKFNKSKYPHHSILTGLPHGLSMDATWAMNGIQMPQFTSGAIKKQFEYDILFFLDVDATPLNDEAIDYYIKQAYNGKLVGNIQRTNHIQNNQHVFAAPSAVSMSVSTLLTIGKPSAQPNGRGDVGEEWTYRAEEEWIGLDLIMPLRFESAPAECPSWALKDGMPVYGRGTTFGISADLLPEREMIWHAFQSFHPGVKERILRKFDEVLREDYGKQKFIQYNTTT